MLHFCGGGGEFLLNVEVENAETVSVVVRWR
jgi:hypothetical protein